MRYLMKKSPRSCKVLIFNKAVHLPTPPRASLKSKFLARLISHRSTFPMPANSPDLNPLVYFLWGFVKSQLFKADPKTTEKIKLRRKSKTNRGRNCSVNPSGRAATRCQKFPSSLTKKKILRSLGRM